MESHSGFELKVGLSPSKEIFVICLIESPLKIMKSAFYVILKVLFVFDFLVTQEKRLD